MKAKGKDSPTLWFHLIILLVNMLTPSPPAWHSVLPFCILQVNFPYRARELQEMKNNPILTGGTHVPDSLHCVQFILVDINIVPKVHLSAYTTALQSTDVRCGYPHCRVCVQQLAASIATKRTQERAVQLKLTSANKSLFHAAATVYVWFTLQWTPGRDLCKNEAVAQATTFITGTAKETIILHLPLYRALSP